MDTTAFRELAELAERETGVVFPPAKAYLLEARLQPIARREGFSSLDELTACLGARPNPAFEREIAAALTAKTTSFFRDREALGQIVRHVLPARAGQSADGKVRVWCAGGGGGQEAYSLAMLLDEENADFAKTAVEILSTDLCAGTTERARAGVYSQFEVQRGLSIHRLLRYFTRLDDGSWRIAEALRASVGFRRQNLLETPDGLGPFDVVLCRNVLTDMSDGARQTVGRNIAAQLKPGGVVFFGEGEPIDFDERDLKLSRAVRGAYEAVSPGAAAAA